MNYKFLPYPPTTKTPGNEGDYYIDTAASVLYMCKGCNTVEETTNFVTMTLHPSFDTVEYVWEEQSGGGSDDDSGDSGYIYPKIVGRTISGVYYNDTLTDITFSGFANCNNLVEVCLPSLEIVGKNAFSNCVSLKIADFSSLDDIYDYVFSGSSIEALILRMEEMATLGTNVFRYSPIANGTGYIYVPSSLLDTYKADAEWSSFTNQFRAIEDYPEICNRDYIDTYTNKNTVYAMGDQMLTNSILDRSISGVFYDDSITVIGESSFNNCRYLTEVCFPSATDIRRSAFESCQSLKIADFPALKTIGVPIDENDFGTGLEFRSCSSLIALILRSDEMVKFDGYDSTFDYSPLSKGTGYIYVPASLIESYRIDPKWSSVNVQFRVLEDYTVDGTITGAIDMGKITPVS